MESSWRPASAEEGFENPVAIAAEINRRRANLRQTDDSSRIRPLPDSDADEPDDLDARLVVLSIDHPHARADGSPALQVAQAMLESRGKNSYSTLPPIWW